MFRIPNYRIRIDVRIKVFTWPIAISSRSEQGFAFSLVNTSRRKEARVSLSCINSSKCNGQSLVIIKNTIILYSVYLLRRVCKVSNKTVVRRTQPITIGKKKSIPHLLLLSHDKQKLKINMAKLVIPTKRVRPQSF